MRSSNPVSRRSMARPPQANDAASSWINICRSARAARGASSRRVAFADSLTAADGGGRRALADCLRESGEPPARARRGAARPRCRCGCHSAPAVAGSSANSSPRVWRWPRLAAWPRWLSPTFSIERSWACWPNPTAASGWSFPGPRSCRRFSSPYYVGRGAALRPAPCLAGDEDRCRRHTRTSNGAGPSARAPSCARAALLVSLQLALSLPLLVGAGLLARTAYNLQRVDLGFAAERLLLVRVDLRAVVPDLVRRNLLSEEILRQIRRVPGVTAATFSQLGIFTRQLLDSRRRSGRPRAGR